MEFSRREQLVAASEAMERHAEFGRLLSQVRLKHSSQNSQLTGLYEEVDKLTKGKTLVPTSDMLVELVNNSISDAKKLVFSDNYLERLKLFVPAGNNPNYPDVLLSLRVLQQALTRFDVMLGQELGRYSVIGTELRTIRAALEVAEHDELVWAREHDVRTADGHETDDDAVEDGAESGEDEDDYTGGEEEEEEEDEDADYDEEDDAEYSDDEETDSYIESVTKSEVMARLRGAAVSDNWFRHRNSEHLFDFAHLDAVGLPKYDPRTDSIAYIEPTK